MNPPLRLQCPISLRDSNIVNVERPVRNVSMRKGLPDFLEVRAKPKCPLVLQPLSQGL